MPKTTDIFYVSGDSHTASPRRLLALLSCSHIASAFARIPLPQGISANANSPHDHGHQIVFKTDVPGDIVLEIHRSWAPIGVERVIDLVSPLNGHRFDRLLDGRLREAGPLCTLSSSLPQTHHSLHAKASSPHADLGTMPATFANIGTCVAPDAGSLFRHGGLLPCPNQQQIRMQLLRGPGEAECVRGEGCVCVFICEGVKVW